MAVSAPDKTKVHTVYKTADGKRVPGVTTILGVLAKPALIGWANRMGLQGIDTNKYVDEKADIGHCCHYMIHCDVVGEKPDLDSFSKKNIDEAENGYIKWLDWKGAHEFELIFAERPLVSEKHKFGGTPDIYALVDGVKTLVDIKTSGSGIWPEMKHQVAGGYKLLLEENGHEVNRCIILRVEHDEEEGFQEAIIAHVNEHQKMFLACRKIYDFEKVAK